MGLERREAVVIDKKLLLSHAELYRKTTAQCVDRDVAANFIRLARFYKSLPTDAVREPQPTGLSRPCRRPTAQRDQALKLVRAEFRSVSNRRTAMTLGKYERAIFGLLGYALIILPWVCAVFIFRAFR